MNFLAGKKGDWELPSVGLPREILHRQEGTVVGGKTQESLKEAYVDLTWLTAQVITNFFEMVIEAVKTEAATKDANKAEA